MRAGQGTNILAGLSGSGALHAWMERSFEYLCLQHALEISRIDGTDLHSACATTKVPPPMDTLRIAL